MRVYEIKHEASPVSMLGSAATSGLHEVRKSVSRTSPGSGNSPQFVSSSVTTPTWTTAETTRRTGLPTPWCSWRSISIMSWMMRCLSTMWRKTNSLMRWAVVTFSCAFAHLFSCFVHRHHLIGLCSFYRWLVWPDTWSTLVFTVSLSCSDSLGLFWALLTPDPILVIQAPFSKMMDLVICSVSIKASLRPISLNNCNKDTAFSASEGKNMKRSIHGVGQMMSTMVLHRRQSVFGGGGARAAGGGAGVAPDAQRGNKDSLEKMDLTVMDTKSKILEILQVTRWFISKRFR